MWRHRLRKLFGLPPADLLLLAKAQWFLWKAQVRLRRTPQGAMLLSAPASVHASSQRVPEEAQLREARRLEQAVRRAAEHGLSRPLCLARALALHALMEARGLCGGRVVVGVQLGDGRFGAHAWVEYGAQVLGDRPARVERYVALQGAQIAPLR